MKALGDSHNQFLYQQTTLYKMQQDLSNKTTAFYPFWREFNSRKATIPCFLCNKKQKCSFYQIAIFLILYDTINATGIHNHNGESNDER